MDSGSEDDIVGVAEALYVKEDDRFHETQALKTENSALSIENGRLKFQDAHREVELKTLRAQICELGVEKLRLKTALNVAYGKFGTKAEGELPTLQAVEIRAILDHAGLKVASLVEGVRALASAKGKDKEAEGILRGVLSRMGMESVDAFEGAEAIETALTDLQKQVRDLEEKLATEEQRSKTSAEDVRDYNAHLTNVARSVNMASDFSAVVKVVDRYASFVKQMVKLHYSYADVPYDQNVLDALARKIEDGLAWEKGMQGSLNGSGKNIIEQMRNLVESEKSLAKACNDRTELILQLNAMMDEDGFHVNGPTDLVGKLKYILADRREMKRTALERSPALIEAMNDVYRFAGERIDLKQVREQLISAHLKGDGGIFTDIAKLVEFRNDVTKAVGGAPAADLSAVLENVRHHVKNSIDSEGQAEKIREMMAQHLDLRNGNRNLSNLSIGLKEKVRTLTDANEQLRQNSSESVYRHLRKTLGMDDEMDGQDIVYEILRNKDNNKRAHEILDDLGVKKGILYQRVKLLADALTGVKGAFDSGEES